MPPLPRLTGHAGLNAIVPAAIIAVVLMMVLPVPPLLLDLLISCNITLSVVTVIATMYIERPVELSVYPSLLLLLTLPVTLLTLGLFALVINALLFMLVAWVVPGFDVTGFWSAFIASILLAVMTTLLNIFETRLSRV